MKNILGKNWQTTLGGIMTAIGAVPAGIVYLDLAFVPEWLRVSGLACSFISFIYMSVMSKSKTVTGVGSETRTLNELKKEE